MLVICPAPARQGQLLDGPHGHFAMICGLG